MADRKELFDWLKKKDKTFTITEVRELLERIKEFNCGAIDQYLTNHVEEEFADWVEKKSKS